MQKSFKQIGGIGALLLCVVIFGFLLLSPHFGVTKSQLEADIRSSQRIAADWTVDGTASHTLAAFISYPSDRADHVFSVYVNRPGFSFGYFFRGGGSLSGAERGIVECTVDGCHERAFISMNRQKVERLEIDDGNSVQTLHIDSAKPFAIVLPAQTGSLVFYDAAGNPVKYEKQSL